MPEEKNNQGPKIDETSSVRAVANSLSSASEPKKTKKRQKKSKVKAKKAKSPFKQPKLYWRLIIAAILALILIGGIFFSMTKLKTLVLEMEQKRGQLEALSQQEINSKRLSLNLASLSKQIEVIEKATPDEKGIIEFINQLEKIEKESGVVMGGFNFTTDQPKVDKAGRFYFELAIQASGSRQNLRSFLEKVLALPFLLKIQLIDFNNLGDENPKMTFRAWLYVDKEFFLQSLK